MRLLPPDWSETTETALIAEAEPVGSDVKAFFVICVLEERELVDGDIYELQNMLFDEPLDSSIFSEMSSKFFEDYLVTDPNPPPRPNSTLGECLLRRAASLGRVDSAALLLQLGVRMDFEPSVLEYEGCLVRGLPS